MAQDPYKYFRPEAREILNQVSHAVLALEKGEEAAANVQRLLRLAHTLKGAARVVRQQDIANHAHAIEDALTPLRDGQRAIGAAEIDVILHHLDEIDSRLATLAPKAETTANSIGKAPVEETARTIRADLAETDAVLDGVTETHALLNALRGAAERFGQVTQLADQLAARLPNASAEIQWSPIAEDLQRKIGSMNRNFGSIIDQMDRELRQLRETAERLRLVPTSTLFTALERIVRDTARVLSKDVAFAGQGGDIRLDVHALDTLQGALIQIMRNAVAHGIETKEERERLGKPPIGSVAVAVSHRDRRVVVSCRDDGRGIDLDAVRRVASQRGLEGSALKEFGSDDLLRMLLRGGLSTSKSVTEESGRGVGLDVVREAVERLGGEVSCRSEPGRGTTFEIVVPPSLSSMNALLVEADRDAGIFAIALDRMRETRRVTAAEMTISTSGATILYGDTAIPFAPLSSALDGTAWGTDRNWTAVVIAGSDGLAAIAVERFLGTAKIVVRPLPHHMTASPVVAATSLDSEGNPQLILDPDGLVAAARRGCGTTPDPQRAKRRVLVVDDSLTTRILEQSILESAGYEVDLAASGEEALTRLRDRRYALILVDVEMPGMDGFTFIEQLRADVRSRDIPAILVTSLAEPEHRKRGRDVGAQGYIVKSEFDQSELLAMIEPMMAA